MPIAFPQIEILPAGEEGPRRLDTSTVMTLAGLPVLTISEFLRAKLKAWVMYYSLLPPLRTHAETSTRNSRRADKDAEDIMYILARYWNRIDINRIPEQDMDEFVKHHKTVAAPWAELRKKYGL